MDIAKNLKKVLADKNVTIVELSELSGVPADTIKNILYGRSEDPRVSTIVQICNALNIEYFELLDSNNTQEHDLLSLFREDSANGREMLMLLAKNHIVKKRNYDINKKHELNCIVPTTKLDDGIINASCIVRTIVTDNPNAYVGYMIMNNHFIDYNLCYGDIILLENRLPDINEMAVFSNGEKSFLRLVNFENGKYVLMPMNRQAKKIVIDDIRRWNCCGTLIDVLKP